MSTKQADQKQENVFKCKPDNARFFEKSELVSHFLLKHTEEYRIQRVMPEPAEVVQNPQATSPETPKKLRGRRGKKSNTAIEPPTNQEPKPEQIESPASITP
jgi:hypothetical protein